MRNRLRAAAVFAAALLLHPASSRAVSITGTQVDTFNVPGDPSAGIACSSFDHLRFLSGDFAPQQIDIGNFDDFGLSLRLPYVAGDCDVPVYVSSQLSGPGIFGAAGWTVSAYAPRGPGDAGFDPATDKPVHSIYGGFRDDPIVQLIPLGWVPQVFVWNAPPGGIPPATSLQRSYLSDVSNQNGNHGFTADGSPCVVPGTPTAATATVSGGSFTVTSQPPFPVGVQCTNGIDDDGDTLIDANDPGCASGDDNSEATAGEQPGQRPTIDILNDGNGGLTLPADGIFFPCTAFDLGGVALYLVIGASGDGTGTWNADTGAMEIQLPLLASIALGGSCPANPAPPGSAGYVATLNLTINVRTGSSTDADGVAPQFASLTGEPIDALTGDVTLSGFFTIPTTGTFVDGVLGLPGTGAATLIGRIDPPSSITGIGLPPTIPSLTRFDSEYIRGPLVTDARYYPQAGFLGVLGAGYDVLFYSGRYCLDAVFQETGYDSQCRKTWSGGGTLIAETDNGLDTDGVRDCDDNCPYVTQACAGGHCSNGAACAGNLDCQIDTDLDLRGDACDPCTDTDGDGRGNPGFANSCAPDNCPFDYNPAQENADADALGDLCDPDDDNDGVLDAVDNCPLVANSGQEDLDGDDIGDACADDIDGDGDDNASEIAAGCSPTDASVFPPRAALFLGGGGNDELLTFEQPATRITQPAPATAEIVVNVHPAVDVATFAASLNKKTNVITPLFGTLTPGCAKRVSVPLDATKRTNRIKLEIRRFPDPGKPRGKIDRDRVIYRR